MIKTFDILSENIEKHKHEDLISYILRLREIKDVDKFTKPSKFDLEPFESMVNIISASAIVTQGIMQNKRFCVYYDVDCDGICSGTIMYKYLQRMNANVIYDINQGKYHGLSRKSKLSKYKEKCDILIIVDSLDLDYTIYDELQSYGIDIVILDHHQFEEYPKSALLVSSAKYYKNPALSGSGVTWKFCAYLDHLTNNNYSDDLVDLCACGILADVCDVSENSPENRYLCDLGLSNLQNTGMKAIIADYKFNSNSVLWSIAPLINATQRMNKNHLALDLFLCDNLKEAKAIVKLLKDVKSSQDIAVAKEYEKAISHIEKSKFQFTTFVYTFINVPELTGLIATKLCDEYQKPALVFVDSTSYIETIIYGSGRSLSGINLKDIIEKINLANVAGHGLAFGINVRKDDFIQFVKALNNELSQNVFTHNVKVDCMVTILDVNNYLIEHIERINHISGSGFKPLTFVMEEIFVHNLVLIQNKHTKFECDDIEFICWKDTKLYTVLRCSDKCERYVSVVGNFQLNNFAGKTKKQFIISHYYDIGEVDKDIKGDDFYFYE